MSANPKRRANFFVSACSQEFLTTPKVLTEILKLYPKISHRDFEACRERKKIPPEGGRKGTANAVSRSGIRDLWYLKGQSRPAVSDAPGSEIEGHPGSQHVELRQIVLRLLCPQGRFGV